jgi:hypothetical protein
LSGRRDDSGTHGCRYLDFGRWCIRGEEAGLVHEVGGEARAVAAAAAAILAVGETEQKQATENRGGDCDFPLNGQ